MDIQKYEINPAWIDVKESLPEKGVNVLTYDQDIIRVDYLVSLPGIEAYEWSHKLLSNWGNVSHWMPLPDKP